MTQIAFIGLGKMGLAMATNIRKAGHPLTVWNRSADKAAPLIAAGASLAGTPREAASKAEIVITSLADDKALLAVLEGPEGILAGMRPGAIHIGTSTIAPALADELAQRHVAAGLHYIAGPVLGRVPAAEAAELMTFLAGDPAAIERARPVIASYAPGMLPGGDRASKASTAKLIANFLGVAGMDLIGQAMAMGERAGLAPELVAMMLNGFFGAEATRDYIGKIATRDFDDVGFTATGGLKDVELMIDTARAQGLELTSALTIKAKLDQAIAQGWRDKDWSCFTEIDRLS